MAVLGATLGIPPHEKTLEFVAADDNAASQVVLVVLPEEELQESELDDFFPVVLDLPESPPPFSLLPAKQFCGWVKNKKKTKIKNNLLNFLGIIFVIINFKTWMSNLYLYWTEHH